MTFRQMIQQMVEKEFEQMILAYIPSLKEMPKDCAYCPFNYDDMYCTALNNPECDEMHFNDTRPASCPLFEVK